MLELNKIYCGDCLEIMSLINNKSINMILCDLPYGTTACRWDTIIPFEPLWLQYKRIIKDNGAIVLTASQPFTSALVMSNIKMFKYCWLYLKDKSKATNFVHAKNSPLRVHEDICVFSYGAIAHKNNPRRMNYNPQGLVPYGKVVKGNSKGGIKNEHKMDRPSHKENYVREFTGYPIDILQFDYDKQIFHPTQKPIALFEYLIKTYTNEGDLILDNCIGSGTTAVACKQMGRKFIGIEINPDYVDIANKRLANTYRQLELIK